MRKGANAETVRAALAELGSNTKARKALEERELGLVAAALNAGADWVEVAKELEMQRPHAHRKYAQRLQATTTVTVKPSTEEA